MNQTALMVKEVKKATNYSLVTGIYMQSIGKNFDLTTASLLVLIGLASHYNPEKKNVFPSQEYLAERLNVSDRTVVRAIKELMIKNLIVKSKNGNSNLYCFTGVFFAAVNLSREGCQIVVKKGDKMSCKHDKYKYKNNVVNFENATGYDSVEATKRYLEEQENIETGSPMDFNYEQAKEFLVTLIPELRNSYFATELRKKWGFS